MKKIVISMLFAMMVVGSLGGRAWGQEQTKEEAARRQLIRQGARLWPMYCSTCHNARTPGEKAPYEWDMVIMHMRSLGNIPAEDARALVEYLKAR